MSSCAQKNAAVSQGGSANLSARPTGGVTEANIQVLPSIAAEKPDPHARAAKKDRPERELRPRSYDLGTDTGKIPMGKSPDELSVQPDPQQCEKEQSGQGQRSNTHCVEQDHRPVVDTGGLPGPHRGTVRGSSQGRGFTSRGVNLANGWR